MCGSLRQGGRGVVPLMWIYLWAVQNIPCRTKGCKSTVLPPEAPTVTSRPLAKPNQRAKVLHCCYDTDLTDILNYLQFGVSLTLKGAFHQIVWL